MRYCRKWRANSSKRGHLEVIAANFACRWRFVHEAECSEVFLVFCVGAKCTWRMHGERSRETTAVTTARTGTTDRYAMHGTQRARRSRWSHASIVWRMRGVPDIHQSNGHARAPHASRFAPGFFGPSAQDRLLTTHASGAWCSRHIVVAYTAVTRAGSVSLFYHTYGSIKRHVALVLLFVAFAAHASVLMG